MLRTAAFNAFDTAQNRGMVSAEEIARLKQWYDEMEKQQKFSGIFSIGNPISKLEDETGLVKLAALGMTGYGGLEHLGLLGGGSASAGGTAAASAPFEMAGGSELLASELAAPTLSDLSAFGLGGASAPIQMLGGSELLANELAAPTLSDLSAFPAGGAGSSFLGGAKSLLSGAKDLFGDFMPSGSFLNTAAATGPILAAINYAKNQGPFDTSRLDDTYDEFDPDALAYEYDQNTARGRQSLTSSLTNRGVMGSSFGNMDMTNFNTSRDLGRRSLVNQGLAQRGNIAATLLDAQIKERGLKNDLYGRSLLALGNVFGGRK